VTCTVGGTTSGYCGDGEPNSADAADQNHQDRDDVRRNRPLDEEF
jgi:hypothetical protein